MDKIINIDNLQGKFLLSYPTINDNRFFQTVVYITSHTKQGAEGLVINKKSAFSFANLLENINNFKSNHQDKDLAEFNSLKVQRGGPVNNDKVFLLHHCDTYTNKHSALTADKIYYSKSIVILEDLLNHKGPSQLALFIGNCVWEKNQLEEELKSDTWFLVQPSKEDTLKYLFDSNCDTLWREMYQKLGLQHTNPSFFLTNHAQQAPTTVREVH